MGVTDGDYRFTPDGPGDEPAPGKGIKQEAVEGSFLHTGSGRYQAPPSYFLIRGDVNSRGSLMKPGFVSVITEGNPPTEIPPADGHTSGRRRALAEWLTSPGNPLTARVAVNRIWHHHFGRGIVATLDNFGKMGEKPTHPELLDWLALEFQKRGWSYKQMHRLIMTSDAYQMASQFADDGDLAKDPDNTLPVALPPAAARCGKRARRHPARERDLESGDYGKPVFPKIQPEILASMDKGIWNREEDGPKVWRRSVYVYRKRGLPFPMFEAFDLPDQNLSCGRRNVSTVPTQALMLLNDEWVLKQAKFFADRVAEAAQNNPEREVDLAYELALSRKPAAEERAAALEMLARHKLVDLTHVLLNLNEFVYEVTMKHFWSRRDFLFQSSGGLGGLALAYLLDQDNLLARDGSCEAPAPGPTPYSPKKPHFPARAKSVISLFMSGGPSHVKHLIPSPRLPNSRVSRSPARARSSCARVIRVR